MVRAGVPQGSVLGPVLYTLFTSDLPCSNKPGTILATYADDTAFIANAYAQSKRQELPRNSSTLTGNRWNISINGRNSSVYTVAEAIQQAIKAASSISKLHIDDKISHPIEALFPKSQLIRMFGQILWSQQFPPLGSNNRKQSQLHHQVVPPRQQQQLSQQQQRPQQQQQQPSQQQQSSSQQLRRSSQQLINDQQWQRQEQIFMQSNQNLSVLVAQMDKLFQMMETGMHTNVSGDPVTQAPAEEH
ncbi:serum response factor homolog A-like [Drosophila suzukii]|uniref:Serum response factor homolog A-like n=1 Tax=Drosophila suzukii TaxID=28584 RepID=A0ABM4TNJ4_DROSZ